MASAPRRLQGGAGDGAHVFGGRCIKDLLQGISLPLDLCPEFSLNGARI
jgi:hypothetical protein